MRGGLDALRRTPGIDAAIVLEAVRLGEGEAAEAESEGGGGERKGGGAHGGRKREGDGVVTVWREEDTIVDIKTVTRWNQATDIQRGLRRGGYRIHAGGQNVLNSGQLDAGRGHGEPYRFWSIHCHFRTFSSSLRLISCQAYNVLRWWIFRVGVMFRWVADDLCDCKAVRWAEDDGGKGTPRLASPPHDPLCWAP
ncbi:hypothetical protein DFH06DRAFT_1208397 [Mycena polygramma]|nr:hypothetical protein DFH06DRAFT_1208397 [Mycena polygramma]